jgi:hypothetical protein
VRSASHYSLSNDIVVAANLHKGLLVECSAYNVIRAVNRLPPMVVLSAFDLITNALTILTAGHLFIGTVDVFRPSTTIASGLAKSNL